MSPLAVFLAGLALVAADTADLVGLKPVDADALIGDPARLDATVSCLLAEGEGVCSEDGKVIRRLAGEFLKNNCADCSQAQQAGMVKFMAHVTSTRPDVVPKLKARYDPQGEYLAKHGDELKAKGVKV